MAKTKIKKPESRTMPRVSVTLDSRSIQASERIQKRVGLASLSAAIRYALLATEKEAVS